MIRTGDTVQTYQYGKPYRTGKVERLSMGKAEVRLSRGGYAWIDTDFLTKIN